MSDLELPGILTAAQVRATAAHIAAAQHPDGLVPWFAGHHADVWDHVEAAMGLAAAGLRDEARRAYEWSADHQAGEGSWPMQFDGRRVLDASVDTNQCAYLAVGVWHDWLTNRDRRFVDRMWPAVRSAIEFALGLQRPDGSIAWSRDAAGEIADDALLTGSACLVLSLRCGIALAEVAGDSRPEWELALARLAHAVAAHPDAFLDKSRYAMDWYYPVLGGAVRGPAARETLARRSDTFVVPGRGVRCVADRAWVTTAETCELALTLVAIGEREHAAGLLRSIGFLRSVAGGYWTGWVAPDDAIWPEEQTTWTAGAVLLAASALAGPSPMRAVVTGAGLPRVLAISGCDAACAPLVRARMVHQ